MARRTRASRREHWERIIRRQQASGLSIQRFCRQEHLACATFFHWKRRLRPAHPGAQASAFPAVNFAAVQVVPELPGRLPAGTIEIVLGRDRRIRLAGPVDKTTLAEVLAVLEGPSPC